MEETSGKNELIEPQDLRASKVYTDWIVTGLRYLTDDLTALRRMSLGEFNLRLRVHHLKELDAEAKTAKICMIKRLANATNKNGEYLVHDEEAMLKKLDIETRERKLLHGSPLEDETKQRLMQIVRNREQLRREGKN